MKQPRLGGRAPLALAALCALPGAALAQTVPLFPLWSATDHERALDADFSTDGTRVFVSHRFSGSIVALDAATGVPVGERDLGGRVQGAHFDDASGDLFVLRLGQLVTLDPNTLATRATAAVSYGQAFATRDMIQVDAAAGVALSSSTAGFSVVDLTTSQEILAAGLDMPPVFVQGFPNRAVLAPGGAFVAALQYEADAPVLELIEVASGAALRTLPLPAGQTVALVPSADRASMLVASVEDPTRVTLRRISTADLSVLSVTQFTDPDASRVAGVNDAGTAAVVFDYEGTAGYRIPLNGGTVAPSDAGVVAFESTPFRRPLVGRQLDRIAVSRGDEVTVTEGISGATSSVRTDRGGAVGAVGGISADGTRFAFVQQDDDRVATIEAGAGGAVLLSDANTRLGFEVDGLVHVEFLEVSGRAVLLGPGSDTMQILDPRLFGSVADVELGGRPLSILELLDGLIAVGLHTGDVEIFDAAGNPITTLPSLGGPAVELANLPQGGRVLVRRSSSTLGDTALVVDLASGAVVSATPLSGPAFGGSIEPFDTQGLAVDASGTFAVAASASSAGATLDVLDLAAGGITGTASSTRPADKVGALLAPDGTRAFVTTDAGDVFAVDLTQPALPVLWEVDGNVVLTDSPNDLGLSSDGRFLYADLGVPFSPTTTPAGLVAIDVATGAVVSESGVEQGLGFEVVGDAILGYSTYTSLQLRLPSFDVQSASFDVEIYDGTVPVFFQAGPAALDREGGQLACVVYDVASSRPSLLVADLFVGRTDVSCGGNPPNSTGERATLRLGGSPFAGDQLTATVSGLRPGGMFGLLAVSDQLSGPMPLLGSQGSLCLGGNVGRFLGTIQQANAAGQHVFPVNTSSMPIGTMPQMAEPGSTYAFQGWHRDRVGGVATSNTSTAVALTFR